MSAAFPKRDVRPGSRYDSLQIYRALAAFAVVLHHVNGKFSAPHYYGSAVPDVFVGGQIGVDFFFVLSGFIITQSLRRTQSTQEFFLHRALRVYPPFWLAFLLTLPVALLVAGGLHSPVISDGWVLLKALLLIPQPEVPVIGVAWTLHHELLFYLLAGLWIVFPVLVYGIAAVLLTGAFFFNDGFWQQFLFSPFHWEFLAGVLSLFLAERLRRAWALPLVVGSLAAVLLCCIWLTVHDAFFQPLPRFLTLTPLFALLIAASARLEMDGLRIQGVAARVGVALGNSSYTLYLWHISLVTPWTKLVVAVAPALPPTLVLLLTLVIACVAALLAHLIYQWVERPISRALQRLLQRRAGLHQHRSTPAP